MSKVYIHSTAEVSPEAMIGEGTRVWNQVQVRDRAVIGRDCSLGKDVFVDFEVRIGDRVKIQNGVSIYHGVTLEDDVFVGPHVAFTNDLYPRAFEPDWELGYTLVMQGASIGANATIICGIVLHPYCMVGAGSVVTRSVDAHVLVRGNPARPVDYVCRCGRPFGIGIGSSTRVEAVCAHCKHTLVLPVATLAP